MNVGSLFAGIGGFDLGFERAGLTTSWLCEQDPFCAGILERRFPGRPIYPDVRTLDGTTVTPVEVLCGGFPCQDLSPPGKSVAGQNRPAGITGARSGLWTEFARLIGEIRPRFVVVENVPGLTRYGLGTVLGDLASLGYDAEWDCFAASDFGAPHQRKRLWIVAYPEREGLEGHGTVAGQAEVTEPRDGRSPVRPGGVLAAPPGEAGGPGSCSPAWDIEPGVRRVADGIPGRVDRVKALGNALVPQIAEWIGRRLVALTEQEQA